MLEATMRPMLATLLLLGVTTLMAAPAQAEPMRWNGNGHSYAVVVVPEGITWLDAKAAASARGGYLATLTSAEENRFVWSLIANQPRAWTTSLRQGQSDDVGPWIGLVQIRHQAQEPKGGWQWISGEPVAFANWAATKPNNLEQIEDYGHFFRVAGSNDPARWNDLPNDPTQLSVVRAQRPVAYIVEFDQKPAP
jgi:hypothetical protein